MSVISWKQGALGAFVLTTGLATGCQAANASDRHSVATRAMPVSATQASTSLGNQPVPKRKSVPINSTSPPGAASATSGVTPIRVTNVGTLTFSGTKRVTSTTATDAAAPFMINQKTGYAAMNGTILRTTDGGKTFHALSTVPEGVQKIYFVNQSTGFLATETGGENMTANQTTDMYTWAIYRTTNDGRTWTKVWSDKATQVPPPYASSNYRFSMFGTTGYAMVAGHLLTTNNGGKTWKVLSVSGTPLDAQALSATDIWVATTDAKPTQEGGVGSGTVQLLHSADGGKHFTNAVQIPNTTLWEAKLSFDRSGNGILLVKDLNSWATTVYWTTDSGKTWKNTKPDAYNGRVGQSEPVFGSGGVAWIALDPGAAPFSGGMTTFDVKTGKVSQVAQMGTWRDATIGSVRGDTIYAAVGLSQGRAIFRSTDSGKTWDQVYPLGVPNAQVKFATSTFGLGVGTYGASGYIYRTSDGGEHWKTVKTLAGVFPSAIAFVNRTTAYVSAYTKPSTDNGSYGVRLYETRDGGKSWNMVPSTNFPSAATTGIAEPTVQTVLSASDRALSMFVDTAYPSTVLGSSNDGKSWNSVATFQSSLSVDAAAYANPSDLWISDVSQNRPPSKGSPSVYTSTIYKANGVQQSGKPTAMWTLPKGWAILGMDRIDQRDAYVYATRSLYDMSQGAAVFATHDGGATWSEWKTSGSASAANAPTPLNLYPSGAKVAMSFADAKVGYLLTANGLLKTTDGGATWTYIG